MESFSVYIIPVVICIIIVFGLFKRVPLFDTFIAGAKEGFQSSISILPSLVGLIMAVTMLSASGALELFTNWIAPVADFLGFHKLSRKVCASWALPLNKRVRVWACKTRKPHTHVFVPTRRKVFLRNY